MTNIFPGIGRLSENDVDWYRRSIIKAIGEHRLPIIIDILVLQLKINKYRDCIGSRQCSLYRILYYFCDYYLHPVVQG